MTDVWDKEYKGKSSKLTPEQKKKAENRARKAGRSCPNMVDNMWSANESVELEESIKIDEYELKTTGKKQTTIAHPNGKPVYDVLYKGKKVGIIEPYSGYKETRKPGARIVSSRKDVTRYSYDFERGKGPDTREVSVKSKYDHLNAKHAFEDFVKMHSRWVNKNEIQEREAIPRNDKRDRKQIDLVVRAVKTARKYNKKMYRQQAIQKQIIDEDMYIPPASQSLNIARGHMPQIKSADYDDFIKFLRAKGIRVTKKKIEPKNYKATQKNFNQDKVAGLMGKNLDKEIFVSKDKYVVDGHHRWLAAWNDGVKLNAYVFHVPIRELIELMREYPKSFKKNISEGE